MTVEFRQQCDTCGLIRVLPVREKNRFQGVRTAAESDGWKEVADNKHMCHRCIQKILKEKL
jgi:hypothetical protein